MLVIVGTRTGEPSLRSQVGIGSESACMLRQFDRILRISDAEAGVKEKRSGGVAGGEVRCGDDVKSWTKFGYLSTKKEANLSAIEIPGVAEAAGDEDLW